MTVTLGPTPFEVRSGVFGDTQAPFNPAGVKQMSGGKVRLSLTRENGEWRSAGLLGPIIEAGKTYELEILGRLDVLDPRVCFAVWGRNDATGEEVDYLEATRWGNPSGPLYTTAWHKDGEPHQSETQPATAFDWHLLTIWKYDSADGSQNVNVHGLKNDAWIVRINTDLPFFPGMRLKIALWVPKTGPLYSAARDRGPLTIDVRGFAVS